MPFQISVKPGSPAQKAGPRPATSSAGSTASPADSSSAVKAFRFLHGEGVDKRTLAFINSSLAAQANAMKSRSGLERTEFVPESLFGVLARGQRLGLLARSQCPSLIFGWDHRERQWRSASRFCTTCAMCVVWCSTPRWCPGGYIDAATEIASTFLEEGLIARMKYRNPERGENTTIRSGWRPDQIQDRQRLSLIVLVNGERSVAARLIAAALRIMAERSSPEAEHLEATIQWPIALPACQATPSSSRAAPTRGRTAKACSDFRFQADDDWGCDPIRASRSQ